MNSTFEKQRREGPVWFSSLFLGVLFLKIAASFLFSSSYLTDLFAPFLNWFVTNGFQNPWDFFYDQGKLRMFPYPGLMLWIMTVPRLAFAPLLTGDWQMVGPLNLFAARLPLLAADMALLILFINFFPSQKKRVLLIYWCSPIIFFINYLHGQLDIIPTALFFAGIYFLSQQRYLTFTILLALSAATKNHVLVALPFLWVFLYKKRVGTFKLLSYLGLFAAIYTALLAPYFPSYAFRQMVFNSPEQKRLFDFVLVISSDLKLVVCPTMITLLFMKFASYRKLNREILFMFLGVTFASLVVLVPPMPGWFLWSLPFLIYFYMHNKSYSRIPFVIYNAVYTVYFLFFFEKQGGWIEKLKTGFPVKDFALSIMLSSVAFIVVWMFNLGIRKNEELKVSEAPLLIGIGGDSGSGKHTLLRVLRSLVGKKNSIPILGDNFHKWERDSKNWNVYTHLNPSANNLHEHMNTAVALREGHEIEMAHYDHQTGKFSNPRPVQPNRFIFFVGLHPFYLKKMRDLISIKIFIDTDEVLRRQWKIKRDVHLRGHSEAKVVEQIISREADAKDFIEPQREFSDLLIRYHLDVKAGELPSSKIVVTFILDNSVDLSYLVDLLRAIPTLSTHHAFTVQKQELSVKGTVTALEIMRIARQLPVDFDELLMNPRGWVKNQKGVAQLVFLLLCHHQRKVR